MRSSQEKTLGWGGVGLGWVGNESRKYVTRAADQLCSHWVFLEAVNKLR